MTEALQMMGQVFGIVLALFVTLRLILFLLDGL